VSIFLNTTNYSRKIKRTPIREPRKNRVIVCEDLDFLWDEPELVLLEKMWESGASFERITERFGRDPDEIFLALFHLAREDKISKRRGGFYGFVTKVFPEAEKNLL
jgi:hypothetical protein